MSPSDRFTCARCGECCRWPGHVLLSESDIARLAGALGLEERETIDMYARLASNRAQLALAERADGSCVFLDGSACLVYAARPDQCRSYPHAWRVREPCPGFSRKRTPRPAGDGAPIG
ncbi:MAG: YkgJ family cysteine cluster protein [Candidatus Eisenbacteria bacterium]